MNATLLIHYLKARRKLLWYILIVTAFHIEPVYAQYENVWMFGVSAGVDFNGPAPVALPSTQTNVYSAFESHASVCDASGVLQFYTDGYWVWDRQNNFMPNGSYPGSGLIPSYSGMVLPTQSTSQGSIIIPVPDHPQQYYIFSLTSWEMQVDYTGVFTNNCGRLHYSVVDMSLNGGLGAVMTNQKGILLDSTLTEHMSAVVGDHCNIWLLVVSRATKQIKAFEITASGINTTPVVSSYPNLLAGVFTSAGSISGCYAGCIAVAPNRRKIAITQLGFCMGDGPDLFDFDPATGIASNQQSLFPGGQCYGICFSSDNSKLYTCRSGGCTLGSGANTGTIIQFDLTAGSLAGIINSKTDIAPSYFTHVKLAPDNKIYFQGLNTQTSLSAINFPNLPGLACQPQSNAILLAPGTSMNVGLPNIVPVFKRDTVHTTQTLCGIQTISAQDNSGWDYIWNDLVTGVSRPATHPGTYLVSYTTPPCVWHTDTIKVLPPAHYSFTKVMCTGDVFDFHGRLLGQPGTYYDTLIAANGCDSTITLDLFSLPSPEVNITVAQAAPLCLGDTVYCEATGANTYQWFSNDLFADSSARAAIYLPNEFNKIMVTGISGNGCRDSAEVTISTKACCDLFVPSAFSPNGDGLNDAFGPVPYGNVQGYQIQIFNRWGQQVFSSFNLNNRWDGTYYGEPAEVGTYFYTISTNCLEGSRLMRKGDITLVR